jgi:tRNA dimethylallyltransferase
MYPPGAVRPAGLDIPRDVLHRRIEDRVNRIMPGLLAEAEALLARGYGSFLTSSQAIGYAEAAAVVAGTLTEAEAVVRTVGRTKSLARRQMAWFRRDPRIRWFRAGQAGGGAIVDDVLAYLMGANEIAARERT